jgi:phosphate transport system permease protein
MPDADIRFPPLRGASGRGEPLLWLSGGAVVVAVGALTLLLLMLAGRGLGNFWPQDLVLLKEKGATAARLGQVLRRENRVPTAAGSGSLLLYRGGQDVFPGSLLWIREDQVTQRSWPVGALRVERRQQAPVFAFLRGIRAPSGERQDLSGAEVSLQLAALRRYVDLPGSGAVALLRLASGEAFELPVAGIREVHAPNAMTTFEELRYFLGRLWGFLSESPREVNAEGGVLPAIVGTVVLVVLMSVLVTPLGVLAAVYLQEYASRNAMTRIVRIAVNNLAGVPAIVYGVFGLGFFVYSVGGSLDRLLFAEALPAPTLGTPGLLWAALTMALLTLPVVIVATEEGLARVPQSLREGSLALGATRAETVWRVVLPAASPALLTGLILAVARATGEVAPLILVGVAKYAPSLPVSAEFPFLHLDRQFMHLGFHVYDLGFQSPQLELTSGRVFSTALLLVAIVMLLNLSAVILRSRLREAFKAQDLL